MTRSARYGTDHTVAKRQGQDDGAKWPAPSRSFPCLAACTIYKKFHQAGALGIPDHDWNLLERAMDAPYPPAKPDRTRPRLCRTGSIQGKVAVPRVHIWAHIRIRRMACTAPRSGSRPMQRGRRQPVAPYRPTRVCVPSTKGVRLVTSEENACGAQPAHGWPDCTPLNLF